MPTLPLAACDRPFRRDAAHLDYESGGWAMIERLRSTVEAHDGFPRQPVGQDNFGNDDAAIVRTTRIIS